MYVLHEPTATSFEKAGIRGKIFPTEGLSDKTEFVIIETETGHETAIIEQQSDFIYYVLAGEGYFEIRGQKETCAAGDLVVIPAGSLFTYKGKLKMLLAVTPPWREEQETTV